jgi:hypothetical protein
MKRWLATRPWVWIVVALALVVVVDVAFLVFAEMTAPPALNEATGPRLPEVLG